MHLHALHWPAASDGAVVAGSPDSVVLLHGLGDTADVWRPMMALWHPGPPVLAFDLPGHGRSPWLQPDAYDVAALTTCVAEALGEHRVRRPLLVGHSLGARVSMELTARSASGVQGCVLVDLGADTSTEVNGLIAEHIDALQAGRDTIAELIALVLDRLPLADPEVVGTVVSAMAARAGELWHVPLDPAIKSLLGHKPIGAVLQDLSRMPAPFCLVRGAYSAVLSRKSAARLAAAVPHQPVPVHEVAEAGHAVPLEQPAALARVLDTCLADMKSSNRLA